MARKMIEKSDINKYRTRKQMIHLGWCLLKDGLVLLLSLGSYRSGYSTDASVDLLQNAMNIRKAEEKAKLKEAIRRSQELNCLEGKCNCAMH